MSEKVNLLYENFEFSLADGQTDYDFKVGKSAFVDLQQPGLAKYVRITSDQIITVKFNAADQDVITINPGTQCIRKAELVGDTWHDCTINILITNASGFASNITIYMS